jgi:hypothetical protein
MVPITLVVKPSWRKRTRTLRSGASPTPGAVLTALREALGEEDYRNLVGQIPRGYTALAEAVG